MCGIIGVLAYGELADKKAEKVRQESMIFLSSELLQLTQPRGKEATGIATVFDSGDYIGLKMGISAQEFVSRFGQDERTFEGYLNVWRKKTAKMVIGHCRKPSVGGAASADDNANNHPIRVGDIIGVHNGTLTNHDKIFEKLNCKRDGKVDSEAIFRLLHYYTREASEPFTKEMVLETCKRLSGQYAVLAVNGNNPYQMVAMRDGRPMEMATIKPLKLILIASEKDYIRMAITRYMKMTHLYQPVGTRFPSLTRKDMVMNTLTDDHMFLFDLAQDITEESEPEQLFTKEPIPRTVKVWAGNNTHANAASARAGVVANGYHGGCYGGGGCGGNTPGQKKHMNTSTQTPTCTQEDGEPNSSKECTVGFSWDTHGMKYLEITEHERNISNKLGPVMVQGTKENAIDMSSGKVIDLTIPIKGTDSLKSNNPDEIGLTESDDPADNLVCEPAKIKEVAMKEPPKHKIVLVEKPIRRSATVDMSAYPEVVKMAEDVTRQQPNFSEEEEVADALNVIDVQSLKLLELHSLANRIQKFFFKKGWEAGYVAHLKEDTSPDITRVLLNRAKKRVESSREIIRNLKGLVTVMGQALDGKFIGKAEATMAMNGQGLDATILSRVIRMGDKMNSRAVKELMESLTESSGVNNQTASDKE